MMHKVTTRPLGLITLWEQAAKKGKNTKKKSKKTKPYRVFCLKAALGRSDRTDVVFFPLPNLYQLPVLFQGGAYRHACRQNPLVGLACDLCTSRARLDG